jgi:hypothetical protein
MFVVALSSSTARMSMPAGDVVLDVEVPRDTCNRRLRQWA